MTNVPDAAGDATATPLTPRERAILSYLRDREGETISRAELSERVLAQDPEVVSRALDTAIARLRAKLPEHAREQLQTVHGEGLRWGVLPDLPPACVEVPRSRFLGGELWLDERGRLSRGERVVQLTEAERRVIQTLSARPGRTIGADALTLSTRLLPVAQARAARTIHRLRSKLAELHCEERLRTERGLGYVWEHADAGADPIATPTAWALVEHAATILHAPDCVLYVVKGERLRQFAAFGPKSPRPGELLAPLELAFHEGIVGHVAATRAPLCVRDTHADDRYVGELGASGRAEVAVPLEVDGHLVGVIDSEHPSPGAFGDRHVEALASLARLISAATSVGAQLRDNESCNS